MAACDTTASLVFTFGTVDVILPSSLLVQHSSTTQPLNSSTTTTSRTSSSPSPSPTQRYCPGTILGDDESSTTNGASPAWILGQTFLRATYTIFRKGASPSVGFAKLQDVYSATSSAHLNAGGIGNAGVGEQIVTASRGIGSTQSLDSSSSPSIATFVSLWTLLVLCTLVMV